MFVNTNAFVMENGSMFANIAEDIQIAKIEVITLPPTLINLQRGGETTKI